MRVTVDLANASVFLDFDGTITTADTGLHLLERLAPPEWRAIEAEYLADRIGSRECMARQWALLPKEEELLRATAGEVGLDPDFEPLVDDLRRAGAEVTVVSDGYGFYAEEVCARAGVDLLTNRANFATGELEFPNLDRCCPCSTCGTCKQAPIKDARRRGRDTIFVGDGTSDRKAALLAGTLFAKDSLADWCDVAGIDFVSYGTLADVRRALV